jgi:hypothetical protein
MKQTLLTITCLLIFCRCLNGQVNLVPNHSFEYNNNHCPDGSSYSSITTPIPWQGPPALSSDYFDTCGYNGYSIPQNLFGYELAEDSSAYVGVILYEFPANNYREYAEIKLIDTLIAGKIYCVSFYVSLADSSEYAISTISAFFSANGGGMNASSYFNYSPQINNAFSNVISNKNGWAHISGNFIASGNELYLTIGNFKRDTSSGVIYVGPPTSGNYVIAYYYLDNVSVTDCGWSGIDSPVTSPFSLYPNPSNGNFHLTGIFPDKTELHIFNLLGEEIIRPIELPKGENTFPIELKLEEGIYIYRIISNGEISSENRMVILH